MKASLLALLLCLAGSLQAQDSICSSRALSHTIQSKYLHQERGFWVSLPYQYHDSMTYPVIYVLDAEWRFNLIKEIIFELGATGKIKPSIIVGIPHVERINRRGIDLTFSHSSMEYDGDRVDSTWYNKTNSGGGMAFYRYLTEELIPVVNESYATNEHETLIGHSLGGYFGAYILSFPQQPFESLHLYDPSIWYGNGETINRLAEERMQKEVQVHVTYQTNPQFHKEMIEKLIARLETMKGVNLTTRRYESETHLSIYLPSFYNGITITNK